MGCLCLNILPFFNILKKWTLSGPCADIFGVMQRGPCKGFPRGSLFGRVLPMTLATMNHVAKFLQGPCNVHFLQGKMDISVFQQGSIRNKGVVCYNVAGQLIQARKNWRNKIRKDSLVYWQPWRRRKRNLRHRKKTPMRKCDQNCTTCPFPISAKLCGATTEYREADFGPRPVLGLR